MKCLKTQDRIGPIPFPFLPNFSGASFLPYWAGSFRPDYLQNYISKFIPHISHS